MKTYSIILLDIDGTLVDSRDQVSENTKKLLNRLEKRGIPIVLCSARSPSGVEMLVRQVELNSPIVCYSGGLILDEERSILEDIGIQGSRASSFKQFAAQNFPCVTVSSYLYDVWLVDSVQDPYIQRLAQKNQCEPIAGDLQSALQMNTHVHKLLCAGKPQEISRLQAQAATHFPNLELARSGGIYLEVFAEGVSKEQAMRKIQAFYNVDIQQIVAIGDYFVDMEMIRHAGLGIAMGNAPEAVKEAAARVTTSNDEEGVYLALKSLHFRPLVSRKTEK